MTNEQNNTVGKHEAQPKKLGKGAKAGIIIACCVVGILICLVSTYFILNYIGKNRFRSGDRQVSVPADIADDVADDGSVIDYKGTRYYLNNDVVSILFMGIDKEKINKNDNYGKNGQADAIFVACLDTKTGSVKIIPISRETMVDVNMYSVKGNYTGVKKEQLCLAYAYGNTAEKSCENVAVSVKRLLYGMNINYYVAVDLDGVGALTDMVGGVTVNSLETIESFKQGQSVTLKGKNAVLYIRARGSDVDGSTRRLERQKQFLGAFASKAGNELMSNFTKVTSYYNKAAPYISTNLQLPEVTYLASSCLTSNVGSSIQYVKINGVSALGEEYVEFTPDSESVYEAVLNTFYTTEKR